MRNTLLISRTHIISTALTSGSDSLLTSTETAASKLKHTACWVHFLPSGQFRAESLSIEQNDFYYAYTTVQ